ncbi:MAG: hypothetical protein OEY89_00200 [Gammaproteobacteria bacterium]|nr:hypothetical protein [Gammaproteobacteria bacterium]
MFSTKNLIFSTLLLLISGLSQAATYYVSPTGSATWSNCRSDTPIDGNAACSPSTAMENVRAGDTVYFRAGNYYPPNVSDISFPSWYPSSSGTSTNPIIIMAYEGETATIYQPNNGAAAVGTARNTYVTWDGFTFIKTTTTEAGGIYRCYMGSNNTIRNSIFIGNDANGSTTNQVGVYINECVDTYIYNNIFRDFIGGGNIGAMWLMEDSNAYVYNNDFYDSDNGIQTKSQFSGIYAYNNFFRGVAIPFHWQQQHETVRDFFIHNNVAILPSGGTFLYAFDPAYVYNNTQVYNNTIYCTAGCTNVFLGNSNTLTSKYWNNIVYGASGTTVFERLTSGPGLPDYMDFNNYYSVSNSSWRMDSSTYSNISSWRSASGFDNNSITTNPNFVNAGGLTPDAYKRTSYPTNGRGGIYASIMGAYVTGDEVIGTYYADRRIVTQQNQSTPPPITVNSTLLFEEYFEDASFAARDWYDTTNLTLSSTEHIPGSTSSAEFRFLQGASTPTSGSGIRKLFTETDSVFVSYWVKYSENYTGSNQDFHPHEFQILTNMDSAYHGPSRSHLTTYIEQNEGRPRLQITDALNIDVLRIGQNLVNITEERSVAGCNGDSDGYGDGDCWTCGSNQCSEKVWQTSNVYFQDTPGNYYKNDWHYIEVYFKLNSISNGIGVADGVMQYWYDGELIIDHQDIMFRTGQHPNMRFNQLIIAPWIGSGSPVDQSMWIDNLSVATAKPSSAPVTKPMPPSELTAD